MEAVANGMCPHNIMSYIKKVILFFTILTSYHACAASYYCDLLWIANTKPIASASINLDHSASDTVALNITTGSDWTLSKKFSNVGNVNWKITSGSIKYWIQVPKGWQTDSSGLKYQILNTANLPVPPVAAAFTGNNNVYWVNNQSTTWGDGNTYGCMSEGSTYNFGSSSLTGLSIEINRGTAFPGIYKMNIPITVAYEENKNNYGYNTSVWSSFLQAIQLFPEADTNNVTVTVQSACNLITKHTVNIDMGNITPTEARSGVTKRDDTSVRINCTSAADISLSFTGMNIVDGINNKTKCGNGSCTLTFDGNTSSKTIHVDYGGSAYIPINVLYQDNSAVAGAFSGSAILSVNIV